MRQRAQLRFYRSNTPTVEEVLTKAKRRLEKAPANGGLEAILEEIHVSVGRLASEEEMAEAYAGTSFKLILMGRHTEAASLCRAAAQHCPASVKLYLGSFEDTVPTTPVVPSAPALAEELEAPAQHAADAGIKAAEATGAKPATPPKRRWIKKQLSSWSATLTNAASGASNKAGLPVYTKHTGKQAAGVAPASIEAEAAQKRKWAEELEGAPDDKLPEPVQRLVKRRLTVCAKTTALTGQRARITMQQEHSEELATAQKETEKLRGEVQDVRASYTKL
ncbi:g7621 [Coccomyxa viridis]|uniref:G7621 protein n=1 Tax=Coccomyxa viridis TaxID=1274662 RepID=A0ABP1G387_9CHLO